MPVFRIDFRLANGQRFRKHHIVDGMELDAYFLKVLEDAKTRRGAIVIMDVVQVSEHSPVAKDMRSKNRTEITTISRSRLRR